MLSAQFADAARALQGVGFVVGGRDPRVGVDCAGLVIVALRSCGCEPKDATYALVPGGDLGELVQDCLVSMFVRIEDIGPEHWRAGDVLLMKPNHMGVYLGKAQMVHALQGRPSSPKRAIREPARGVVLSPIDHGLERKVASVWRLRSEA